MTDPIGTAQERELIERLRFYGEVYAYQDEAADALQSRIAEVESLKRALQLLALAVERRWPDSDFSTSEHFAEPMNQARAALSLHRRPT